MQTSFIINKQKKIKHFTRRMTISKRYSIAVIVIICVVIMMQVSSSEGGRKIKKCQFKSKRTRCVDVIPKREKNRYKFCPNFDISTLGRCTQTGGQCKILFRKGKNRCLCDEKDRHRLVRDQPWGPTRTF